MVPTETSIATYSGRLLDLAAPDPSQIELEDIVAGLSKVCRFGGQSLLFYSVAQHAVAVSLTVQHRDREDLALAALHHDSHDAYICDVPRPLKQLLDPRYSEITDGLDRAIATKLEVELPPKGTANGDLVKAADDAVLRIEAAVLLHAGLAALGPASESRPLDQRMEEAAQAGASGTDQPWSPETAAENFRKLHDGLATEAAGRNG